MKKFTYIALGLLIFGLLVGYIVGLGFRADENEPAATVSQQGQNSLGNCLGDQCLIDDLEFPIAELPEHIQESLRKGLDDEYKALSTYRAVMAKYGNVRPFVMIARAEQQHINALQGLFEKYGLEIPQNPYLNTIVAPESLQIACQTGVDAEIENVKLYKEELSPLVKEYPDITQVYANLMNASEQKHLPAFERCN